MERIAAMTNLVSCHSPGSDSLDNESESVCHSVVSNALRSHGPASLLLCPWDSPGKKNGVGCHLLLQGNFPTPGMESGSPASQAESLPSETPGKPLLDNMGATRPYYTD